MPAVGGAGAGAAAAAAAGRYKVVLLGVEGCGKSTFASRFSGAEVEHNDAAAARVVSVRINAEETVELWISESAEPAPSFLDGASGALLMFDTTSRISYKETPNFYRLLQAACPECPTVMVGLKVDVLDRKVKSKQIMFHRKKNLAYKDCCARSNFNVKEVLQALVSRMSARIIAPIEMDVDKIELEAADAAAAAAVASAAAAGSLYEEQPFALPLDEDNDDL